MTVRFKNELVRNITIKLGYANAKVRLPFSHLFIHSPSLSLLPKFRSTNAPTKHAPDQDATAPTPPQKRTTPPANVPAAATA